MLDLANSIGTPSARLLPGDGWRFLLTLETVWSQILKEITTTPASSEIGRLAQLLKAARLTAPSADDAAGGKPVAPD